MTATGTRESILIVEDERGPRESLRLILKPSYDVLLAANGQEALQALRERKMDLVTLDLNMPGVKGIEVLRALKTESPSTEVVVITGFATLDSAVECIRHGVHDFITKPFNVIEVMATVERALRKRRSRARLHSFLDRLGDILGRSTPGAVALSAIEADEHLVAEVREALTESFRPISKASAERVLEFAEVLADTLESKDAYTHGHSRRVSYYAGLLAEHAGLQPDLREEIRLASFLHDVGKIGVANQLILKDGHLTQEERMLVMKHPVIGESLIQPLGLAPGILRAVRHHHEHFDGSGYPDKLAGNEIPLGSRVILIADAYDAMHSQRSYRKGLSAEMIVREFTKHSGTQFDPHLTAAFLDLMEKREDAFAAEV